MTHEVLPAVHFRSALGIREILTTEAAPHLISRCLTRAASLVAVS